MPHPRPAADVAAIIRKAAGLSVPAGKAAAGPPRATTATASATKRPRADNGVTPELMQRLAATIPLAQERARALAAEAAPEVTAAQAILAAGAAARGERYDPSAFVPGSPQQAHHATAAEIIAAGRTARGET